MAEALARHIGDDHWVVESAGTSPAGWISEEVGLALHEEGVPAEGLRSKGLDAHDLYSFDIVVILSGHDPTRIVPEGFGGRVLEWPLPDPVGLPIDAYRSVREQLRERIQALRQTPCVAGA